MTGCACCDGLVESSLFDGTCDECALALLYGREREHPHDLSAEQLAALAEAES